VNSTDPESAVEIEQRQLEQKETKQAPDLWAPSSVSEIKQEAPVSPSPIAKEDTKPDLVIPSSSELSFVCLLIPRFSDHHLVGDISEDLVEWMKQICISYGWRLDAIAVRPGYLQWVMIVPLNTNPAQIMRMIRQHTSQRIFDDYPRFKRLNMSGQFWAPGNFVVAGNQLQTLETINSFILQTRRHQGIV
jgi:REP element-mobilizing transposase RayT